MIHLFGKIQGVSLSQILIPRLCWCLSLWSACPSSPCILRDCEAASGLVSQIFSQEQLAGSQPCRRGPTAGPYTVPSSALCRAHCPFYFVSILNHGVVCDRASALGLACWE